MDQRQKEDKLMKDLKEPDKEHSADISRLINNTIRAGHKVWLGTDWHLWLRDVKDKPKCHERSDFNTVLNNFKNKVGQDDLLIYLGDLVDGEFQDKPLLRATIQSLGKNMVFVRGNNDLFPDSFYKECGFKYVVESFVWSDVLFTHIPCTNKNKVNVHGHIHGFRTYWLPYTNQVDVAAYGGRKEPVELMKVINAQPSYAKTIKECPEHFGETYLDDMNLFYQQLTSSRLYDPFRDE